jgi:cytochrome c-type biogenesis protein CcmE
VDPRAKRKIRLVVALTAALLLAGALAWTSFSASSEARTPSDLLADATPGQTYALTGTVLPGHTRRGTTLSFRVRAGRASVPVTYQGAIPDAFRAGREVIVDVRPAGGGRFVGERDSLITKCPSKFTAEKKS